MATKIEWAEEFQSRLCGLFLRKENPEQANSRYIIAEPVNVNRQILEAIGRGEFDVLEDLWRDTDGR